MRKIPFILLLFCLPLFILTSCKKEKQQLAITQTDIQNDVLGSDIKVAASRVESSEAETDSPVTNTIDGDYKTIFHSQWQSAETTFPVTLTYYFSNKDQIDYTKVTPRQDGYNGFWIKYDVYAKSADGEEKLIESIEPRKRGRAREVGNRGRINLGIEKPEYVKFVIHEGVGNVVSCGEIEFFKNNSANVVPSIFTDGSATALKSGVKSSDIEAVESNILKQIAQLLKDETYDNEFRVKAYKAILSPNKAGHDLKIGIGFSRYQNITGIFLEKGEHIVLVGPTNGKQVGLLLPDWMRQPPAETDPTKDPQGWGLKAVYTELNEGVNIVSIPYGTNAYVQYFDTDPETAPEITVHFPTGQINGYFDASVHTDEDWNRLLDNAPSPVMDAFGEFIQVAYPVKFFKQFTYGKGLELINNYDSMLLKQYTFNGFKKYDKLPKNKILARVNFNYYMFRDGDGVGYLGNETTMRMVADPSVVIKGDPCWGFSHEVGHVLQMSPQLRWGGLGEVSNNLFSLYTTTGLGNPSRLQEGNLYESARKSIVESNPKISYLQDDDVFHRLVPFWQLHLYFGNNGIPDFYADMMEHMRNTADAGTGNESINNMFEFIKLSCDLTKTDLTDFFEKWGFFYVGTIELDDYGKYTFNITQKQVNDTRSYIASKQYAKPAIDITTVDDNTYKK